MAAGDVAAQADLVALAQVARGGRDARDDVLVAGGAVRDEDVTVLHHAVLLLRAVDAVRHDRRAVAAEEAVARVGVGIRPRVRAEGLDPFDL